MGNLVTFISFFIVLYCVYQLGSLAGIFSERSGVANVAIEGNMIIGAVLFAIIYETFHAKEALNMSTGISFFMGILITVPLGAVYMMLLSHLTNKYYADHIIVGTGMNLLAPALMILSYIIFSPYAGDYRPSYIIINMSDWIWHMKFEDGSFNNSFNFAYIFLLMTVVIIIVISWMVINKTSFGMRLKSSGENPYSLETSGVSVHKTRSKAIFISGLLSTYAGAIFIMGPNTFLFTVNGSGFLAIGIMILGQYRVLGTTIGSLILSAFISMISSLQYIHSGDGGFIDENRFLVQTIPFIIPIIGLMIFRKSYVPKAVGTNFKKDQR